MTGSFLRNVLTRLAHRNAQARAVKFFSRFIGKGDLCFDIGANAGDKTKAFLRLGARVVCLEPQGRCLDELRRLFGKNKDVVILGEGVAGSAGFLDLSICKEMPNIATFSDEFKAKSAFAKEYACRWQTKERVAVTTLDALITRFGLPHFCKIDVEGFEEEALKGLTQAIAVISFEYDDCFFTQMENCLNRLSQLGTYEFNFTVGEPADGKGLILAQWVDSGTLLGEIYSLKKKTVRLWGDIYAEKQ